MKTSEIIQKIQSIYTDGKIMADDLEKLGKLKLNERELFVIKKRFFDDRLSLREIGELMPRKTTVKRIKYIRQYPGWSNPGEISVSGWKQGQLGLSTERVRQIEAGALRKIRRSMDRGFLDFNRFANEHFNDVLFGSREAMDTE